MNKMNLFNEGILLVVSMTLPFFIEISLSKDVYNAVGWLLVGLLAFCMLANLGILIAVKGYEVFVKCCKKKRKEQPLSERKKLRKTEQMLFLDEKPTKFERMDDEKPSKVKNK